MLSPSEAVDAALADGHFGPWVASQPVASGNQPLVEYDVPGFAWRAGLITFGDNRAHVAVVDAMSGKVVDVVVEPWEL